MSDGCGSEADLGDRGTVQIGINRVVRESRMVKGKEGAF